MTDYEKAVLATLCRIADALDAIHGTLEEWRLSLYADRIRRIEVEREARHG